MSERDDVLTAAGAERSDGSVRHFGDPEAERAAVADRAGVFDARALDRVLIAGPDAEGFLDRLLTRGVRTLSPGQGGRAYLLDARGRVVLAFDLYRLDADRFRAVAAPGHGAEVVTRLDMFHFGEQLSMEAEAPGAALELHGPEAPAIVEALGLRAPDAPGAHGVSTGGAAWVARHDRAGVPGFLVVPDADAPDPWRAVVDAGARPVGLDALEAARVEAGLPAHPAELGEHSTPLEMGTMDGITEGKGCYPGQEVIERTIALGRPARVLTRLRLDGPIAAGQPLLDADGAAVGTVTSVAPVGERPAALALIKHRAVRGGGPWRVGATRATADDAETGEGR